MPRSFLLVLSCCVVTVLGQWPHACDSSTGYNATRCQAGHTCCHSIFSGSQMGCCPLGSSAVCCSNRLTCCPQGTEGTELFANFRTGTICSDYRAPHWPSWGFVTTCVPDPDLKPSANAAATNTTGVAVCKPGAPLPLDPHRKNVLVIGDSVSIG